MSFHDPRLAELVNGSKPARIYDERLVRSHLPLVRKLAWQVHGRAANTVEIDDLLQIGMVALVEAAHGFEDRGLGFSNYAKLRVRGAMIDHLRKLSNLSRSAMAFAKQLRTTQARLAQELGRSAEEPELAAAMGMDPESFRLAMDRADAVDLQSMDEVYSDQNIWFEDQAEKADDALERAEMQEILAEAIGSLPERDGMILQLYFVEEMNLDEIGKAMDIGAARVCQIKKAALAKLQRLLAERGLRRVAVR